MRCVVTGGAGFVGSHLCERLVAEGDDVLCLDNLVTGSEENLAALYREPRFVFERCDIALPFSVAGEVAAVVNLASPASPIDYARLPLETLRVGSAGTDRALELARAKGARFLQASTSEIYGDPEIHPQCEGYWGRVNPVGPRACYDEAKRYAEALVSTFRRQYRLDARIARIFNTYGPRMRAADGRIVPTLLRQALFAEPLTIFGDGSQTRSFCYVADLVEGLLRLLLADAERGDWAQPVNLGNPDEITILGFAALVRRLAGSAAPLRFLPLPADDPRRRRPDISRARVLLDWEPRVPLAEGLRRTLAYFRAAAAAA